MCISTLRKISHASHYNSSIFKNTHKSTHFQIISTGICIQGDQKKMFVEGRIHQEFLYTSPTETSRTCTREFPGGLHLIKICPSPTLSHSSTASDQVRQPRGTFRCFFPTPFIITILSMPLCLRKSQYKKSPRIKGLVGQIQNPFPPQPPACHFDRGGGDSITCHMISGDCSLCQTIPYQGPNGNDWRFTFTGLFRPTFLVPTAANQIPMETAQNRT